MTELTDDNFERFAGQGQAVSEPEPRPAVQVGLDDGYALTKVVLPDGRLWAIPSRGRIGRAGVTWLRAQEQSIFEYETEGTVYSVGSVDGEPTTFEGYPTSGLNRAIVQHALQQAGLGGQAVQLVSGLPVAAFYRSDGQRRQEAIQAKRDSLKRVVQPRGLGKSRAFSAKAEVVFHAVIPEALAAWYDHVIVTQGEAVNLDSERLAAPVAIVDIGGRTTDFVVVQDQGIIHDATGSLHRGLLAIRADILAGIQERFDLVTVSEQRLAQTVASGRMRLHGRDHDVSALVKDARQALVSRLYAETRRQLGLGTELDRVLFVGGGSAALEADIADWFPHQAIADQPVFANARGMLKYLQFVCEEAPQEA